MHLNVGSGRYLVQERQMGGKREDKDGKLTEVSPQLAF